MSSRGIRAAAALIATSVMVLAGSTGIASSASKSKATNQAVQRALTVDTDQLAGPHLRVTWFEPVTGRSQPGGVLVTGGHVTLTPPFAEDAVLTLEA